ncbi:unnamed protein product [Notodromas monacha]|uniref:HTH CENPB-type domain-containing protein n=1 Tax=Notodromas monacha TaxID=399045 RepID=A0A7R9BI06_9CRUS|nr:unnamed protein product [Notodromas monacha]CAG0915859.1 unnamed protein product [Notodromas monacha]
MWSTRDKILGACETAPKGASRIPSKTQRHPVLDELEKLLLIWIEDMQRRGDPVSGEHICRKARKIYEELIKEYPDGEGVENEEEEDGIEEEIKGFKVCNINSASQVTVTQFWKEKFTIVESILLITKAWKRVTQKTLNSAWKTLMPRACQTAPELDDEEDQGILAEIVATARNLHMDVDEEDLTELV